jgi:hypothetical protein
MDKQNPDSEKKWDYSNNWWESQRMNQISDIYK